MFSRMGDLLLKQRIFPPIQRFLPPSVHHHINTKSSAIATWESIHMDVQWGFTVIILSGGSLPHTHPCGLSGDAA